VEGLALYPGGLTHGMLVFGRSRKLNVEPRGLTIGVAFEK
jgi:hypothetical protein